MNFIGTVSNRYQCSGSLTSDSSGELHVLGHDGDSLSVDGTEVGVLEESNHVSLSGLLESEDGGGLESKIGLEIVGDLSDESLERKFSNKEFSRFLESSGLSEGDGSGLESVGSLDTGGGNIRSLTLGRFVGNGLSGALEEVAFLAVCLVLAILTNNYN